MWITVDLFGQIKVSNNLDKYSNTKIKTFSSSSDTIQIDTLSIISGSLILETMQSEIISNQTYYIDDVAAKLVWITKPSSDSVKITYKVFPYLFGKIDFRKDKKLIEKKQDISIDPFIYVPSLSTNNIFEFGGVNYNGSFSRGISFGNNQNVVVNSSLNLQIAGEIGDGIEVNAALTDNNIPLQPDGNTQQLQEFDKVFIQLKKSENVLIAGDYEVKRPDSYFLNFYRNSQGIKFSTVVHPTKNSTVRSNNSMAVTRGKFARQTFAGQEGNQGPYKLIGNNGETFIIVLAPTERVYIDGLLLQRGSDRDYVIDYNLGEVIFTPNRLITKDMRIMVEFEYSDQNYFRSLFFFNEEFEQEKLKVKFNLYSEQDSKNQPVFGELSPEQKQVMARVGDSIYKAFFTGAKVEDFDNNKIMYRLKRDTLVVGDSIFIYSTHSDSARYVVAFTNVGQGNGNYILDKNSLANGKVYRWVAPIGGILQGEYEPVLLLVTPRKQQLYTLGLDYTFDKRNKVMTELALSNSDINTFSKINNSDNNGLGVRTGYINTIQLKETENDLVLQTEVNYEYINKLFKPVERYRPVEFSRDWNIASAGNQVAAIQIHPGSGKNISFNTFSTKAIDEHYARVSIDLQKNKLGNIKMESGTFQREGDYSGYLQNFQTNIQRTKYRAMLGSSLLTSTTEFNKTLYIRPRFDVARRFEKIKNWQLGLKGEQENNKTYSILSDTLLGNSLKYYQLQTYASNADTAKNRIKLDYTKRYDYVPLTKSFSIATQSNTANINGSVSTLKNNQFGYTLTYRELNIVDSNLTLLQPDQSILGRLEHSLNAYKGFIRTASLYELGSGREQKREFRYIPTQQPGTGTHIWIDYNSNGVPEINEYELAPFSNQGEYIKVLVPSNEYIRTYNIQFNQSLDINPKVIWNEKTGVRKFLTRFSNQSAYQIARRTLNDKSVSPFNPFLFSIPDSFLVSINSNLRNVLYFNRTSSNYGIDYSYQENTGKSLLVNGFETRERIDQQLKFRWNLSKTITYNLGLQLLERSNITEFSPIRNYLVEGRGVEPMLSYLGNNVYRITILYNYSENFNQQQYGGEAAYQHKASTELRYNIVGKGTLNLKVSYVKVNYVGQLNSPVAFAILEGLQNGNNTLWNLVYERQLSNNVQLSLNYEGRKTGDNNTVHIGRAQVRALF